MEASNQFCMICQSCYLVCELGTTHCPQDGTDLKLSKQNELLGKVIAGRYKLLCPIGVGAFTVVFKAMQLNLNRYVAVKVLSAGLSDTNIAQKRFELEATCISEIIHPNVVTIIDFGITSGNRSFIVMEYIRGKTFQEIVKDAGPMSEHRAAHLAIQSCQGLAIAHNKGIVHRDVKPSNILVVQNGQGEEIAKVVDFGLAKFSHDSSMAEKMTKTGETVGTPGFMSPEQCRSLVLDQRSDVYSLGCVIYFLVTGKEPFEADNALECMTMHVHEKVVDPTVVNPKLQKTWNHVLQKALAKEPSQRYQTILEFANAIDRIFKPSKFQMILAWLLKRLKVYK